MAVGVPKAGFRRTKRYLSKLRNEVSLEDVERDLAIKLPHIMAELEKLTKPISCPHCGNKIKVMDKDVGMYLVDRVLGKPRQRTEVDITEHIILSADQIDQLLVSKFGITIEDVRQYLVQRALPVIEGETKLIDS